MSTNIEQAAATGTGEAISVIVGGVLAAAVVVTTATWRAVETFRPEGLAWTLPIEGQRIEAIVEPDRMPVSGLAESLTIVSPAADALAYAATAASILLWALTALTVIGGIVHLAWNVLRGRVFSRTTVRDLNLICGALVGGAALIYVCDDLTRRTLLASLEIGEAMRPAPVGFWISWAVGFTTGLLAYAFRRGLQLQRDTEGLV